MHKCSAAVVTCIDFRLQKYLHDWLDEKLPRDFDRIAVAGGVKNLDFILSQIMLAEKLHHIEKVILVNHEDCGAYGELGTKEKHVVDLTAAAEKIKSQFPDVEVETYYLHLDGTFEKI